MYSVMPNFICHTVNTKSNILMILNVFGQGFIYKNTFYLSLLIYIFSEFLKGESIMYEHRVQLNHVDRERTAFRHLPQGIRKVEHK